MEGDKAHKLVQCQVMVALAQDAPPQTDNIPATFPQRLVALLVAGLPGALIVMKAVQFNINAQEIGHIPMGTIQPIGCKPAARPGPSLPGDTDLRLDGYAALLKGLGQVRLRRAGLNLRGRGHFPVRVGGIVAYRAVQTAVPRAALSRVRKQHTLGLGRESCL